MRVFICILCFMGVVFSQETKEFSFKQQMSQTTENTKALQKENNFTFLSEQSPLEGINGFQYLGVVLILLSLLAFLWYVKSRLNAPQCSKNPLQKFFNQHSVEIVQVRSITSLSVQSKLVIFEAYGKRYFVAVSQGKVELLDSYVIENFKDMLASSETK